MKKNKLMRLASVLLVLCLLTTSVISGTFAKYTTQDAASDAARVAKWGVALQVIGNLYGVAYKDAIVSPTDTSVTVRAADYSTADDVVAPGTKNDEGMKISLTGTPEVSTQVVVEINAKNVFLAEGTYGLMVEVPASTVTAVNFTSLGDLYTKDGTTYSKADSWETGKTYYTLEDAVTFTAAELNTGATSGKYYPVVYTLAGDTTYTGNDTTDTINGLAAAIAGKFGTVTTDTSSFSTNGNTKYTVTSDVKPPQTDLDTTFKIDDLCITWAWAFTGTNSGDSASLRDKADTILGLLMQRDAAGSDPLDGTVVKLSSGTSYTSALTQYTDYCLDTAFSIDITVNQVD